MSSNRVGHTYRDWEDNELAAGSCGTRCFTGFHLGLLCLPCNLLCSPCRHSVSRNKRRFRLGGFDLDLTYTAPDDRVITMGFPAAGVEHFYRNPRSEVRRFLDSRHADHYKVFNLCCEPGRGYSRHTFHGRIERYPFRDHCVPTLEAMVAMTNSAKSWTEEDPENVVAIHCKAGKGRAGTMTCMTLLRLGYFDTAQEAIDHYDKTRVSRKKGLTVTSQIRFVHYFERLWRECWGVSRSLGSVSASVEKKSFQLPEQPEITVLEIRIVSEALVQLQEFKVFQGGVNAPRCVGSGQLGLDLWDSNMRVKGNFCIRVGSRSYTGKFKYKVQLWENTAFLANNGETSCEYSLSDLDVKKSIRSTVGDGFCLEVDFRVNDAPRTVVQKIVAGSRELSVAGAVEEARI